MLDRELLLIGFLGLGGGATDSTGLDGEVGGIRQATTDVNVIGGLVPRAEKLADSANHKSHS